ncbi:MAG: TPM domain-containing protein [Lachnospiraceae bacterium]|nr:TPM domain-containing protein [Lachnospiraceae bacterium]
MRNVVNKKTRGVSSPQLCRLLLCLALMAVFMLSGAGAQVVRADNYMAVIIDSYNNDSTGYQVIMEDDAGQNWFSQFSVEKIKAALIPLSYYGDVALHVVTGIEDGMQANHASELFAADFPPEYDESIADYAEYTGLIIMVEQDTGKIWMTTYGSEISGILDNAALSTLFDSASESETVGNDYERYLIFIAQGAFQILNEQDTVNGEQIRQAAWQAAVKVYDISDVIAELTGDIMGYEDDGLPEYETGVISYTNEQNGYTAIIEDDASLLSETERQTLLEEMKGITEYGNVAFKTIARNNMGSTGSYASQYYYDKFASNSGTVFLIDMDERNIYIFSNGAIYKTITKSYADTITDNIYTYASKAEYYTCASKAFEQITALLAGQHIRQPMKYASNTLLGIVLALLINYFLVRAFSAAKKPSGSEVMEGIFVKQDMLNFDAQYERETRQYSPQSSGSGGGGALW